VHSRAGQNVVQIAILPVYMSVTTSAEYAVPLLSLFFSCASLLHRSRPSRLQRSSRAPCAVPALLSCSVRVVVCCSVLGKVLTLLHSSTVASRHSVASRLSALRARLALHSGRIAVASARESEDSFASHRTVATTPSSRVTACRASNREDGTCGAVVVGAAPSGQPAAPHLVRPPAPTATTDCT
jgi:hypothetical protein